ncbi:MAG: metal-dependent transcriptional regulator [Verrucomicrobiota bacterium]
MPSSTVENYTKNIYLLAQSNEQVVVPMGEVARAMGVVPGTATAMIKTLDKEGLAVHEPRSGVRLTDEGEQLALRMLRRHRLIEYFLVETLKMDWTEIHEEAEALEHAVSDRMLDQLDNFLGMPRFDPHGDPIPTAEGKMHDRRVTLLADLTIGKTGKVARVADQQAAFLDFVGQHQLFPGVAIEVKSCDPTAGILVIDVKGNHEVTLSMAVAAKIWIEDVS